MYRSGEEWGYMCDGEKTRCKKKKKKAKMQIAPS